jgi:tellurite resistance protein TehA-like permease
MSRSFRDCVEHFPLSIFALVMGVAGLGLGLRTWGEYGGPAWLAEPVLMFAWMVFFLLGMLFIFKAVRYPAETIVDLRHPVRLNYLAAISISIVLMSMVLRPHEPLAAMSIALMDMAQLSGVAFYFWAGLALLFLVAFLVFVFLAMTVRAGFLGNFCRAEDP